MHTPFVQFCYHTRTDTTKPRYALLPVLEGVSHTAECAALRLGLPHGTGSRATAGAAYVCLTSSRSLPKARSKAVS